MIGRSVRFEGGNVTVVGVMPSTFQLVFPPDANVPLEIQAWTPFPYDIYALPRDLYFIRIIGRIKTGATLEQAQQDANAIARQLRAQFNEFGVENMKLEVAPLHRDAVSDVRTALINTTVNNPKGTLDGARQTLLIKANDQLFEASSYNAQVLACHFQTSEGR